MSKKVTFSLKLKAITVICLSLFISLSSYVILAIGIFRSDKQDFIQEAALTRSSTLGFDIQTLLETVGNQTQYLFPKLEVSDIQKLVDHDRFILGYYQVSKVKKNVPSEKYANEFELQNVFEYRLKVFSQRLLQDPSLAGKRVLSIPPRLLIDMASLQNKNFAVSSSNHLTGTPSLLYLHRDPSNPVDSGNQSGPHLFHITLIDLDMINQQFANDSLFKNSLWNFQGLPLLKHGTLENTQALSRIISSHELNGVEKISNDPDGNIKLMGFSKIKGLDLLITSVMDEKIAYKAERLLLKKSILYGLILFSLSLICGIVITAGASNRIYTVINSLKSFLASGTPTPLAVTGSDEASMLCDTINTFFQTNQETQKKITAQAVAVQTQDKEREKVRILTRVLYPTPVAQYSGCNIASFYRPTVPFSGTWWHHFQTPKGVCLFVCDAVEKGVEAMVGIGQLKATLHSLSRLELNPSQMLHMAHEVLLASFQSAQKYRAFCCVFIPESKILLFASAGHISPLIANSANPLQFSGLAEDIGTPIGSVGNVNYTDRKLQLTTGDIIYFYNQGFAQNSREDNNLPLGPKGILSTMLTVSKKYSQHEEQISAFGIQINKILGRSDPLHDSLFIQFQVPGE